MEDPLLLILGVSSFLFLLIVYFVWKSAMADRWRLTSRREKEGWKKMVESTKKEKGKKKMEGKHEKKKREKKEGKKEGRRRKKRRKRKR